MKVAGMFDQMLTQVITVGVFSLGRYRLSYSISRELERSAAFADREFRLIASIKKTILN